MKTILSLHNFWEEVNENKFICKGIVFTLSGCRMLHHKQKWNENKKQYGTPTIYRFKLSDRKEVIEFYFSHEGFNTGVRFLGQTKFYKNLKEAKENT